MTRMMIRFGFHRETEERPGWCSDPHLPPCAAYVTAVSYFSSKRILSLSHHYSNKPLCFLFAIYLQLCRDNGDGLFQRGVEMCVAYDSGALSLIDLFFLKRFPAEA